MNDNQIKINDLIFAALANKGLKVGLTNFHYDSTDPDNKTYYECIAIELDLPNGSTVYFVREKEQNDKQK